MPGFATHYLWGELIKDSLSNELITLINRNIDFYNIGLQGPDILFFYKPIKSNIVTKLGNDIHKTGLINTLNRYKGVKDEKLLSYILGYTVHFLIDTKIHPIVNRYCHNFNEHILFESGLDYYTIEKYTNVKSNKYKKHKLVNDSIDYEKNIKVFYDELEIGQVNKSIYDMKFYFRFLYSPFYIKQKFISLFCKLLRLQSDFSYLVTTNMITDDNYNVIIDILSNDQSVILDSKILLENCYDYLNGKGQIDDIFDQPFDH